MKNLLKEFFGTFIAIPFLIYIICSKGTNGFEDELALKDFLFVAVPLGLFGICRFLWALVKFFKPWLGLDPDEIKDIIKESRKK